MGEVFSTTDHLGNSVYCTNKQWYGHIIKNHSIMARNMDAVKETINTPDSVYKSEDSDNRKVFFKKTTNATYGTKFSTKVIVECSQPDEGEVVTTFPTKAEKGGIGDVEYKK